MKINGLLTQNLCNPIGIGTAVPRFSYSLHSDRLGDGQTAYRILAASSPLLLNDGQADLWDSKKIVSARNYALPYSGLPLQSRQTVFWKVQVWDAWGTVSGFSDTASFEMGLLRQNDWKAAWIGQGDSYHADKSTAPALVGRFAVYGLHRVRKARIYISGLGLFHASMNGRDLSENLFEPGESEYNRRVYYTVYDITPYLQAGDNVIGVLLGNGQYVNFAVDPVMKKADGSLSDKHRYQKDDTIFLKNGICGDKKLIVQAEITYADGRVLPVSVSDESWKLSDSPITFQNWYGGEDYDAQKALEMNGWDTPAADHSTWQQAVRMQPPLGILTAREFLPVRIWETWAPQSVSLLANGNWLVDMGKNSAGFLRLKLDHTQAWAGSKIEIYPAEVLKEDGSGVDQASCTQSCNTLYQCTVKDSYTIAGTGHEEWHPIFCYHGFQYAEITGFPGIPTTAHFEGCAVRLMNDKHSDFETDHETINAINRLTDRSIESNMMFSFTDCPQIEKLGWLETTQLMFSSMAAGYDIRSWIPKIMQDMRDAQITPDLLSASSNQNSSIDVSSMEPSAMEKDAVKYPGFDFSGPDNCETQEEGFVPGIAPEYHRIGRLFRDPNWGGACIMTPWYYYMEYGDEGILEQNFSMMQRYLKHLERQSVNGVLKDYAHMGEWGQLHEDTPTVLVATCAFYLQAVTVSRIADILSCPEVKVWCDGLAARIRTGFHHDSECYHPESEIYGNDSQASYGCVLFSGIIEHAETESAIRKLLFSIDRRDGHLSSGEVGLKQVFHSLAANGENHAVYRMVMNETAPSYRYYVDQGLTTLPEYWNYTELWNGLGRSRNHAMMGHVKEWLCRFVLGITPLLPGYDRIQIKPWLQEELHRIKGSIFTVHGSVCVDYFRQEERITMITIIPPGSLADLYLPYRPELTLYLEDSVYEGDTSMDGEFLAVTSIPSGRYTWTMQ